LRTPQSFHSTLIITIIIRYRQLLYLGGGGPPAPPRPSRPAPPAPRPGGGGGGGLFLLCGEACDGLLINPLGLITPVQVDHRSESAMKVEKSVGYIIGFDPQENLKPSPSISESQD